MIKTGCLVITFLFLCSNLLLAQVPPAWGGGADQNDLNFGFAFGYVSSNFKITKKPDWRKPFFDKGTNKYITDSLNSISSAPVPGFSIGFITRYRLTEHFEARFTPALVFADRSISYTYATASEDVTKQIQPTTVEIPLSLKLRSDRLGNFRAYILGGVKYTEAIGKGAPDPSTDPLQKLVKNTSGFGSYEAGLGCDIYFEFFKLSPEIKISNSFGNVLIPENQPFSAPISKLSLHTIVFSLCFE
ncbi:MAG: hypothetical protein JWQ84_3367 [Mucilaginibacter sp.]|jgi:hypothetical protein|nr:hypothetical protein [Mucilaginibacter sp.]MDB5018535.1 hypothetical protein [Mucilaginibacter sp.]MDB5140405.1 hypothetical protein [Mucilaginibacter sp.]